MTGTTILRAALTAAFCLQAFAATAHEVSNAKAWSCTPTGPDNEWHCASRSVLPPALSPSVEIAATPSVRSRQPAFTPADPSLRQALANAPDEAWVLQLNAVVDPARIRAQQAEMGDDLAAVVEIVSGRRQLWALIQGVYPDRNSAENAAGELNTTAYVRSVRSLRQALAANF